MMMIIMIRPLNEGGVLVNCVYYLSILNIVLAIGPEQAWYIP